MVSFDHHQTRNHFCLYEKEKINFLHQRRKVNGKCPNDLWPFLYWSTKSWIWYLKSVCRKSNKNGMRSNCKSIDFPFNFLFTHFFVCFFFAFALAHKLSQRAFWCLFYDRYPFFILLFFPTLFLPLGRTFTWIFLSLNHNQKRLQTHLGTLLSHVLCSIFSKYHIFYAK